VRARPQDQGEEEAAEDAQHAAADEAGGGWDDDRDETGFAEGGGGSSSVFEGYYRAQQLLERSVRARRHACLLAGGRLCSATLALSAA
jgi:hypothetical protein